MQIFAILSGPLGWILKWIYTFVGNYGVAIILFTVLIRVASMPLQLYQQKSMAKLAVFQPMMQEIQTKYKNNQQKQNEELMKLQQEYGYNPTAGCFPMVLNMFVLFGVMYAVYDPLRYILGIPQATITALTEALGLTNSLTAGTTIIQMAHEGAELAGLSAEQYAAAASFNVDFFGINLCSMPTIGFNLGIILPVLACLTMVITNIITLSASGQQMQGAMKLMPWMMSIFFAWFCFTVPLAFSLYYCVSNVLMFGQTIISKKIYNPEKMREQAKAELGAKRKAARAKKTITYTDAATGETKQKTVNSNEMARIRMERARQLDEQLYADERTEPLKKED